MSIARHRYPLGLRRLYVCVASLALSAIASFAVPALVWGQTATPIVNEKFADLDPAIAQLREEVGQERREIVKANMLLTESEAKTFWPLYDRYRAARVKLGDRKLKLITDYVAALNTMTEDEAERLTKEYFAIEKKKIAIKENYVAKMSKVLSARTVARFFQIDQKLDATGDMILAAKVPLIH